MSASFPDNSSYSTKDHHHHPDNNKEEIIHEVASPSRSSSHSRRPSEGSYSDIHNNPEEGPTSALEFDDPDSPGNNIAMSSGGKKNRKNPSSEEKELARKRVSSSSVEGGKEEYVSPEEALLKQEEDRRLINSNKASSGSTSDLTPSLLKTNHNKNMTTTGMNFGSSNKSCSSSSTCCIESMKNFGNEMFISVERPSFVVMTHRFCELISRFFKEQILALLKIKKTYRINDATIRQLWSDSALYAESSNGKDRMFRLFQYVGRFMSGVTDFDVFTNLMKTMALTRKSMRFWGAVVGMQNLCMVIDKVKRLRAEKPGMKEQIWVEGLDVMGVAGDSIYRLLDHVAFLERIKLLKISPLNAERLDRLIEASWFLESVPTTIKELILLTHLKRDEAKFRLAHPNQPLPQELQDRRQRISLALIKFGLCDIICNFYTIRGSEFRAKRSAKVWCGALGIIASLIGAYNQWKKSTGRDIVKTLKNDLIIVEEDEEVCFENPNANK